MQNENRLGEFSDSIKCQKHYLYRDPRRRETRGGAEHIFEEITAEHFPNLRKERDLQIQETQASHTKSNQGDLHQDT